MEEQETAANDLSETEREQFEELLVYRSATADSISSGTSGPRSCDGS